MLAVYIQIDFLKHIFFCFLIFFIGALGVFITRRNLLLILMSIELMLLASNLFFVIFSIYLDDILGQLFSIFILTIAASESAIGLALIVCYYNIRFTISTDFICSIKG